MPAVDGLERLERFAQLEPNCCTLIRWDPEQPAGLEHLERLERLELDLFFGGLRLSHATESIAI
jgi:hypothetical protein